MDVHAAFAERGVVHEFEVEADGGVEGIDAEFAERAPGAFDGVESVVAVDDELGDHGVVVRRDAVAGDDVGIDADAGAAGDFEAFDLSRARHESSAPVLGVDPAFDGVAVDFDIALPEGQFFAACDAEAGGDDIDAGDHLGDGVLDLDAGVDLEEVEVLLLVHEEFDGGGAGVLGVLDEPGGGLADLVALLRIDARCWGFFDELLVATLGGAVAFVEMDGVAVFIADDLDLDVAGVLEELFDVDGTVAERGLGFLSGLLDGGADLVLVAGDAHAAPAAARCGFDDDRVAGFFGDLCGFVLIFDGAFGAREDGDLRLACHGFAGDFVAEEFHGFGRWADEFELAIPADAGEVRVLGEEAVAGVNGVGVHDFGGGDDARDVEVALVGGARADADGGVGEVEVGRAAVGLRIDAADFDAEVSAGADDPQRDLTTVGDKDSLHRNTPSPPHARPPAPRIHDEPRPHRDA